MEQRKKWILGGVAFCITGALWFYFLRSHAKEWLHMADGIKARRYEPKFLIAFFSTMVLAVPCATLPNGAIIAAGMLIGYTYGAVPWTLVAAWCCYSTGLCLVFLIARTARQCRERRRSASGASCPDEPEEENEGEGGCLDGEAGRRLIQASSKLLEERPRRTFVLLSLAAMVPQCVLCVLGAATDVGWSAALLGALVNGMKGWPSILKGAILYQSVSLVSDGGSSWEHWKLLGLSLFIGWIVFVIIFYAIYRAKCELEEMGFDLAVLGISRGSKGESQGESLLGRNAKRSVTYF